MTMLTNTHDKKPNIKFLTFTYRHMHVQIPCIKPIKYIYSQSQTANESIQQIKSNLSKMHMRNSSSMSPAGVGIFNCSRRRWYHRWGRTAAPPLEEAWRRPAPPGRGSLPPSPKRKAGTFLLSRAQPWEAELLCCIPSRCSRAEVERQVAQLLPSPPASREKEES